MQRFAQLFHQLKYAVQSSIRYKIFLLLIVIISVLIILFSLISFFVTAQTIERDYITYKMSLNQQTVSSLDDNIGNLIQQTYQIYNNYDDLLLCLRSESYGIDYMNAVNRLKLTIRSIVESSSTLYGVSLTNVDGDIIVYRDKTNFQLTKNNISDLAWFEDAMANNGRYAIIGPHMNSFVSVRSITPEVISIAAALMDLSSDTPIGAILVDQNVMYFDSIIANLSPEQDEYIIILNENGDTIYRNHEIGAPLLKDIFSAIGQFTGDAGSGRFASGDGREWLLTYSSSPKFGWSIVSVIPTEVLTQRSDFVRQINMTLLLVLIAVTFFISLVISSIVTSPLKRLHHGFEELKSGQLGIQLEQSGHDEMSQIIGAFNDMSSGMDHMIREQFMAQINLQRAELESLQSQINPHFLYNTLNSIKSLSDIRGDHDISKMIQSLASIFRYNLNRGQPVVKLYDEIEHLRKYLFLQNIRHNNQLLITWDINERAMECEMVRFTLQPIAENIFEHAFRDKRSNCRISVSANFEDSRLIIRISNNGAPMHKKQIDEINAMLDINPQQAKEKYAKRVGIYNVNSRIKYTFGEEYGLRFEICEGMTNAVMCFPIQINPDEIDEDANNFRGNNHVDSCD